MPAKDNATIPGASLASTIKVLAGLGPLGEKVLKQQGISKIDPKKNYPSEIRLKIFEEVRERFGTDALYTIGIEQGLLMLSMLPDFGNYMDNSRKKYMMRSVSSNNKIRNYNFIDQAFVAEKIIEKSIKNETKNSDLINNKNDESVSTDKKSQENIKDIVNSNIEKDAKIKLVQKKLEEKGIQNLDFKKNVNRILFVIKNRFVGLDGVATVTSYPEKNFRLFFNSLKEEFNPNEYGFYQKNFIIPFEQKHLVGKEYEKTSRRHYGIILPGIISFLSTPGSKIFLFFSGFFIFMLCAILELLAKKMTYGSIIFSNLVGYVLGYRLIHFGYIPKQSYLLLGAIILTIIIIKLIKSIIIKSYNVRQSY